MIKLLRKFGFAPRVAVWELTLSCNLNCRHCGSRAGKPRPDELTLGEALKLCEALAEMKCRFLTLGGGEPLLRRDWPIIAEKLVDLGITVGMISNALIWTHQMAHTAKNVGLESVAFSLDGFEETHDYLRRSKGLYKKVLDAFDECHKVGLKSSAITTIFNGNLDQLEDLREILAEHNVHRWQLQLGSPSGNLADHRELVISPEAMLTLVPRIADMCRDKRRPRLFPAHDIGYFGEPEEFLRNPNDPIPFWTGCSAGCSVIGIESNGNIKGCLSLPSSQDGEDAFVEGNIRETPLQEIWKRKGAFAYNRQFSVDNLAGFCKTCEYAEVCRGGCTWFNFTQNRFIRDNKFCYWRQLMESQQQKEASTS